MVLEMVIREEDPKMSLKDTSRVKGRKPKLGNAWWWGGQEEQNRVVM